MKKYVMFIVMFSFVVSCALDDDFPDAMGDLPDSVSVADAIVFDCVQSTGANGEACLYVQVPNAKEPCQEGLFCDTSESLLGVCRLPRNCGFVDEVCCDERLCVDGSLCQRDKICR